MKRHYLGELEELILMTVAVIPEQAYGVAIIEEIERQTNRKVGISAAHTVLKRLENKGFLESKMGGASEERGGRRKRLFEMTSPGKQALQEMYELRNKYYEQMPASFLKLIYAGN